MLKYDALNSPGSGYLGLDTLPTQTATVNIPNPSSFALIPVGQLATEIIYKGHSMGFTQTVKNISLLPGSNIISLIGPLNPENITVLPRSGFCKPFSLVSLFPPDRSGRCAAGNLLGDKAKIHQSSVLFNGRLSSPFISYICAVLHARSSVL